jgi:hypothetical protein
MSYFIRWTYIHTHTWKYTHTQGAERERHEKSMQCIIPCINITHTMSTQRSSCKSFASDRQRYGQHNHLHTLWQIHFYTLCDKFTAYTDLQFPTASEIMKTSHTQSWCLQRFIKPLSNSSRSILTATAQSASIHLSLLKTIRQDIVRKWYLSH